MSVLQKDNNGNITNYTGVPSANEGLPLGFIFASALPQVNANYHLLNGDSVLITDYSDFYTLLTTLVSQSWNLTCTANEYAEDIAKTGNCGKFVINTTSSDITGTYDTTTITVTANSFKLPTITKFIQGISNITDLGNSVEAGLPNITGQLSRDDGYPLINIVHSQSGALQSINATTTYGNQTQTASATRPKGFSFDASQSNSIYGNSSTVQPQATQYLYYIVLKNNSNSGLMNYLTTAGVQSIGGTTGNITLGNGLSLTNNELNTVVYSWQKLDVAISTETTSSNFTTVDLSSVIPNWDSNGEYELLLSSTLIAKPGQIGRIYLKSDVLDYTNGTGVSGISGTTGNLTVVDCYNLPAKRYFYWKTDGILDYWIYLNIRAYRRIK